MVTIVNSTTGKVLRGQFDDSNLASNEIAITELQTEYFVNPYFNFQTKQFYEGATEEEIIESNKPIVPQEVQLWRVRTVLRLMDLETTIATALDNLQEPTKTAAKTIWEFGTTIERQSQTVLFLQSVLQMTDDQVDNIFIQAEAISI